MGKTTRAKMPGSGYYVGILRKDCCAFCGKKPEDEVSTVDHIQPSSRRGLNCWLNFAPACERCNNKKGNLTLLEFLLLRQGVPMVRSREIDQENEFYDPTDSLKIAHMSHRWYNPLYELLGVENSGLIR
jgi:hypothetical protein